MNNEIKYTIPVLAIALGGGLPKLLPEVLGFSVSYDVDAVYFPLLMMFGFSLYYWGKKFSPIKLKRLVKSFFIWSDKSLGRVSLFLFFVFLIPGLLSAFAIVVTNHLDGWLKITLGLLFCVISGYAFLRVLIFDRMDDNSGF